jgi:hypothetical protein
VGYATPEGGDGEDQGEEGGGGDGNGGGETDGGTDFQPDPGTDEETETELTPELTPELDGTSEPEELTELVEICDNGVDDDNDGQIDADDSDCSQQTSTIPALTPTLTPSPTPTTSPLVPNIQGLFETTPTLPPRDIQDLFEITPTPPTLGIRGTGQLPGAQDALLDEICDKPGPKTKECIVREMQKGGLYK